MRWIVAAVALAWSVGPPLQAGAGPAPHGQAIRTIETALPRLEQGTPPAPLLDRMTELKVPAVSIAFIEAGEVKWARAYGLAAPGVPATPDTLFQAASLSKAVAAAGALRLVDRGRLSLDGDVNARLKAWKIPPDEAGAPPAITLRNLLSHTAGLTVSGYGGYPAGAPRPTLLQMLDGQPPANTPPVRIFEPPGAYAYSGGGYTVAQLLTTEAGGRPYPDLLRDLVLRPAGMRRSTFAQPLPDAPASQAAIGHDAKGAAMPGGWNVYPEYAAAGLWTTPADYGRFLIAVQASQDGRRGGLLRPATARAMLTPVDGGYGLGVALGNWGGRPYMDHGGSNVGFRAQAMAFLDGNRQGVVIMTNGDSGGLLAAEILRAVADAYGWGTRDPGSRGSLRRAPPEPGTAK